MVYTLLLSTQPLLLVLPTLLLVMLLQEDTHNTNIRMIITVMAFYIATTNVMNIGTKDVMSVTSPVMSVGRRVMRPIMSVARPAMANEVLTRAKIKSTRMSMRISRKTK
eukprot:TRINITY_DN8977_c0_g1_i3.p2 TRINITY_DN8977_c0_g1~~TRINITY_DN8977_c0_g1_i3.p2  ORF type:complete len:109 (-),score=13.27 TRINITY_DN8977_c0_g1_i3:158-484(-)